MGCSWDSGEQRESLSNFFLVLRRACRHPIQCELFFSCILHAPYRDDATKGEQVLGTGHRAPFENCSWPLNGRAPTRGSCTEGGVRMEA